MSTKNESKKHDSNHLIGAHMSIVGGLHEAILQGRKIQCTAIQFFLKSNRSWNFPTLSTEAINLFKKFQQESGILPVAHTSYLINLASPKKDVEEKSLLSLKKELEACDQLNIPYLVLHPGSHLNDNLASGITRIINNLLRVFSEKKYNCTLLLETMAGQGTTIGKTFNQLGQIINNAILTNHLGVCLDTCHIFAAGYRFDTPERYQNLINELKTNIGLEKIKVIHLNNSKKECGSALDRHEHLDKGLIPLNAFSLLLRDPIFLTVPKILETPKENGLLEDIKNLEIIRSILNKQ